MRNIALKIISSIAVSLVLLGIASSHFLVKILMIVLPGFRDSVYREASTGSYHSLIELTISALIVVAAVYFFLWGVSYTLKRAGLSETLHRLFQCTTHHTLLNVLALFTLFASLTINMWVIGCNAVTTYSLSSIEMLAPEIPEHTRLRLRLDFFCMRHADDFDLFHEKLQVLSRDVNVSLSDFDLL